MADLQLQVGIFEMYQAKQKEHATSLANLQDLQLFQIFFFEVIFGEVSLPDLLA